MITIIKKKLEKDFYKSYRVIYTLDTKARLMVIFLGHQKPTFEEFSKGRNQLQSLQYYFSLQNLAILLRLLQTVNENVCSMICIPEKIYIKEK